MYARWASFAVGLWLVLAPLVLGYGAASRILHDVAMGVLVCIATLAALERPSARYLLAAPAAWLFFAARGSEDAAAAVAELVAGALLVVLSVIPSARFEPRRLPRAIPRSRAGARA